MFVIGNIIMTARISKSLIMSKYLTSVLCVRIMVIFGALREKSYYLAVRIINKLII